MYASTFTVVLYPGVNIFKPFFIFNNFLLPPTPHYKHLNTSMSFNA